MADPPGGDKPQYKVYRAGSDAPPRDVEPPAGAEQQRAPQQQRQPPPAQQPPAAPGLGGDGDQPSPNYKVYRSKDRLGDRIGTALPGLPKFKRKRGDRPEQPIAPRPERSRSRTVKRVLKYGAAAAAAWILLSVVLFFVSAQTQQGVDSKTSAALSNGGTMLTGSTVLVLGSDARPKGSKEPGASAAGNRSDSILLMHVGLGSVRRLSIPRDSVADIPGFGRNKINAAFALGGPALTIKTVEGFLGNGLKINHVILVDFTNFPHFIDSLGGVDVTLKRCLNAAPFDKYGPGRGRKTFKLKKGTHHLNGEQALAFSRVRKNRCAPGEDDRARAARQQQVLSGLKGSFFSPRTFFHAPWVAWDAPRAIRSDMHGFGLSALAADVVTGGSGKTEVLQPDSLAPFIVSDAEKRDQVNRLLGK